MKKVVMMALLALCVGQAAAQSVDEIVEKGVTALGGRDRLKALRTRYWSGDVVLSGGAAQGTFELRASRPQLFRIQFDVGGLEVVQAYDGSRAWQIVPAAFGGSGKLEVLEGKAGDTIRSSATFETPLLDYRSKGHQVELVGRETVGERDTFHLRVKLAGGRQTDYYLDATTYLSIKTLTTRFVPQLGGEVKVEQEVSDYREVDGIQVPHKLTTRIGGNPYNELTLRKVVLNQTMEPSAFQPPAG